MCLPLTWIIVCSAVVVNFSSGITGKEGDKLLEFMEQPSDTVALRDDPAQLNCRARALSADISDSDIQVQWFHNGKLVRPSSGRTVSLGVLFFVSVHTHDVGVYWCSASVKGYPSSTVRSQNATLQIAYLREEFLKVPSRKEVSLGGTAILECAPPPGLPQPTVEWLKEGVIVNVGSGPSSRLRLEGLGNLVISDARASDNGAYVCKADNAVGNRETPPATLRVLLQSKPRLIKVPEDKTVLIPESGSAKVQLECFAAGDPLPRIVWRRNGHELTGRSGLNPSANDDLTITIEEDRRASTHSYLTISNMRADDQGNYTCEAENSKGRVASTALLTVHYRPRWVMPPESQQQVKLSSPLFLRCEATGNPRPDISWSWGSSRWRLSPGQTDGEISVDSYGTLRIARVEAHHEGIYICTARSLIGQITATARVEVLPGRVPMMPRPEHPLVRDLFSSPWLLLFLSAILCLILICVAVTILLLLRRMNSKTQSAVTEVPVSKGADINFFTDLSPPTTTEYFPPSREKMVLYENKLNIDDCNYPIREPSPSVQRPSTYSGNRDSSVSGPYAATTIVPSNGTRIVDGANFRTGDMVAVNRTKAYPVARGAQGAHELENLLHSGYSNSASSSSETSSFGKRSACSSRSSSANPRVRVPSPSPTAALALTSGPEPIYSIVHEQDDSQSNKIGCDDNLDVISARYQMARIISPLRRSSRS